MTDDEQLKAIEEAARGFSESTFRYSERIPGRGWGDILIVPNVAEDDEDPMPVETLDEHVARPIADMLNAVAPLVAEVRRLRAALQQIAEHPHCADDYMHDFGDSAVSYGYVEGHQCAAEIARAVLGAGKEGDRG